MMLASPAQVLSTKYVHFLGDKEPTQKKASIMEASTHY